MASLNNRELELKKIYDEIRTNNDGDKLVDLVDKGKLKSEERDALGMCPLILAVDCGFELDTLEKLIDLGCDPYTVDDNGDTLLHYAVNLDNSEVEEWLINKYKVCKDIQNNDKMTAYD